MGLDILFSSLSIDHLMTVLSVFLLEKHMVLISEDIHRLTLSVLCLQELIRPLTWQGTFVPVLPDRDDYLGMLESPVPYVIGLIKTGTQPPVPDYATVVDLDLDQVIEADRTPLFRQCPMIASRLRSSFDRHVTAQLPPMMTRSHRGSIVPNPKYASAVKQLRGQFTSWHSYTSCERKFIFTEKHADEIANIVRSGIAPFVEKAVRPFFVTDTTDDLPVTVFNQELFLQNLSGNDLRFYQAFCETQMFHGHLEKMMDERVKESRQSPLIPKCG
jgi:hypothetical protein